MQANWLTGEIGGTCPRLTVKQEIRSDESTSNMESKFIYSVIQCSQKRETFTSLMIQRDPTRASAFDWRQDSITHHRAKLQRPAASEQAANGARRERDSRREYSFFLRIYFACKSSKLDPQIRALSFDGYNYYHRY